MLHVTFAQNTLAKGGAVVPRVVQRETISFDEVLAYMAKGTVVSESDMTAVLTHFTEAVVQFLARGKRVQTPLGALSVHLRGAGQGSDPRSVSTASLTIRIRPATAIADALKRDLQVAIVDAPPALLPLVYRVSNAEDETSLNTGKPGEILHLSGARLSLDPKDPEQGVFFVGEDGLANRASAYSRLGSRQIDCKIPSLPEGGYVLEVRTRPGKVLKVGSYQFSLTVTSAW
jgi:nucleoid DNA-binding protein